MRRSSAELAYSGCSPSCERRDADTEIALRGRDRWVRRFDQVRLEPATAWLRDGGVYLLTGGLGGIALRVAEHLAVHARVKLVLIGRTALPDESDSDLARPATAQDDETSQRIAAVHGSGRLAPM